MVEPPAGRSEQEHALSGGLPVEQAIGFGGLRVELGRATGRQLTGHLVGSGKVTRVRRGVELRWPNAVATSIGRLQEATLRGYFLDTGNHSQSRHGQEFFQLTLGGSSDQNASLGDRLGPGLPQNEVPAAIRKIVDVYLEIRALDERFLDTYRRVGIEPFKAAVYGEETRAA